MAWADMKAIPKPAATTCLTVSLLAASMAIEAFWRARRSVSSITERVSDPGSRAMSGSRAIAASGRRRARASRCSGAAMTTIG